MRAARARGRLSLRAGFALVLMVLPFLQSAWPAASILRTALIQAGAWAIALCILGRCWCALYIGGRKGRELVCAGPYSVSRNPLYLFTFLGALGMGLQSGSCLIGVAFVVIAALFFFPLMLAEERVLAAAFGSAYEAYRAEVPRLLPRLARWRDAPALMVFTRYLRDSIGDSLLFLVAIPLFLVIDWLQRGGIVPVILRLP
jgi:protein-S-isoprenylcysteine O-methyltransferase Ste14